MKSLTQRNLGYTALALLFCMDGYEMYQDVRAETLLCTLELFH